MTVTANSASGDGGGISMENTPGTTAGTLTVNTSIISNNQAGAAGGGVADSGNGTVTISTTDFQGNTSSGAGGGVYVNGTTLTVTSSTFVGNKSANGGGIEIDTVGTGTSGSAVANCTFTANNALYNSGVDGGGIDAGSDFSGSLKLLNNTINANSASDGGGLYWSGNGAVTVQNTIIAGNSAGTGPDADFAVAAGTFTDLGGNLISVSGAGSGNTGFTNAATQTGTATKPLHPLLVPCKTTAASRPAQCQIR